MINIMKYKATRVDEGTEVEGFYFKAPLTAETWGADHFSSGVERHCIASDTGVVFEIDPETVRPVEIAGHIKNILDTLVSVSTPVVQVDSPRTITVNPLEWDDGIIDCPFADQDSICLRAAVEGMSAVYCHHCGLHEVPCLDKCPLEDGPVEVRLAASN